MTEENKEFVDAYIFMTYENMLKVFENNCLKIIFLKNATIHLNSYFRTPLVIPIK